MHAPLFTIVRVFVCVFVGLFVCVCLFVGVILWMWVAVHVDFIRSIGLRRQRATNIIRCIGLLETLIAPGERTLLQASSEVAIVLVALRRPLKAYTWRG